ncbi:MAG TPA: DUF1553 domain-containing protein, partial [Blastocatellia bacterium]|nr:DUF1553 domain-containing protein [Blastocatellia bacterium]
MNRAVRRTFKLLLFLSLAWISYSWFAFTPSAAQVSSSLAQQAFFLLQQKCAQCHGASVQMSGLDLRTREVMLKGGASGAAIVPGKAEASLLYRRVTGAEQPQMPLAPQSPLTAQEIALLKTWIDQGAQATNVASTAPAAKSYSSSYKERPLTADNRNWWAFQVPQRPPVPAIRNPQSAIRNPIDAFVQQTLDQKGLTPAPPADRHTLIRRATLDLLGLLPSPQEVAAFVNDPAPDAYENLIERLLASPHYGERWGRFWLDVVRYADSSGYEHDFTLANAWRYRDYVIKSFNEDKPYDRFLIEQLAGDELDDRNFDSLIATTFYRIGPRVRFREKDNPYYRYEYLDDTIRTTFQGFMGLSVNCARCHDHKFDPISQMDYYHSMALLFGNVDYDHPLAPPDKVASYEKAKRAIEAQTKPLLEKVIALEAPYRRASFEKRLAKFPEEIQSAVRTPEDKRTPGQKLLAAQIVSLDVDPDAVVTAFSRNRIKLSEADEAVRRPLLDQIEALLQQMPASLPVAEGVRDGDYRLTPDGAGDEPLPGKGNRFDYGITCCFLPQAGQPYHVPPVYFGANGVDVAADQKSFVVEPGFLRVLANDAAPLARPPKAGSSSGRRRALAEWIVSPRNPLTARVLVNRVWQWHFGRGLVATPGNFGKMGAPPSHPALLDWLAVEFMEGAMGRMGDGASGRVGDGATGRAGDGANLQSPISNLRSFKWSIKHLHRLIMNSAAYQQASSFATAANLDKDPTNIYLWRFPVRRLEAEAIRDAVLSASGQLNLQAGGEPFFPAIPKAVRDSYLQGKWVLTKEEPATWRRSIYSYWKRGLKYPLFEVYDQPDPNVTCERRNTTTVPTQALTLLNNEFVLRQARHLAERVRRAAGNDAAQQIQTLYQIALSRAPERKELEQLQTFLQQQRAYHQTTN